MEMTVVGFLTAAGKVAAILAGSSYVGFYSLLIGFQRRLIWMRPTEVVEPQVGTVRLLPNSRESSASSPSGTSSSSLSSPSMAANRTGPVATCFIPPRRENTPTLVHFHGNADQIGWGPEWMGQRLAASYGFGFFAVEYPSYGLSKPGEATEMNAYEAAERALRFLSSKDGWNTPHDRIVLIGESIGASVALEMANRGYGTRVILLAPFYSLRDLILQVLPKVLTIPIRFFPFLLFDKLENFKKISTVPVPVCIIHGDRDSIVPFSQGQRLAAVKPNVPLKRIPGGDHNNLFDIDTYDQVAEIISTFSLGIPEGRI